MKRWGCEIGEALCDLLWPRRCAGCGAAVQQSGRHLCWECLRALTYYDGRGCSCCGHPADGEVSGPFICGVCRRRSPHFDRARSCVRFSGAARELIHALKYKRAVWVRRELVALLTAGLQTHLDVRALDAIVPVPLHPRRRRDRGYNQSAVLARGLGRAVGLPVFSDVVVRVNDTPSQTSLTASQRRRNVRGAFAIRRAAWVAERRFLVVDDVMTTGATLDEVARVLRAEGAVSVSALTVARG
jgi:ComF family protein